MFAPPQLYPCGHHEHGAVGLEALEVQFVEHP
jgi:hypothetical protein